MITELANYQERPEELRGQISGLTAGLAAEANDGRHLENMQVTFQLSAGGRGVPSPHWYQRLPVDPEDERRSIAALAGSLGDERS